MVCEETLRAMSAGNFKAGQQGDNLPPAGHETLTIATLKGFVPLGFFQEQWAYTMPVHTGGRGMSVGKLLQTRPRVIFVVGKRGF